MPYKCLEKKKECQKRYRDRNKHKSREYYINVIRPKKLKIKKDIPLKTLEEKRINRRNYESYRYKTDLSYRLKKLCRNRIKKVLKNKTKKSSKLLGCSGEYYVEYLKTKFLPGMTIENFGFGKDKWSIDHIKPLAAFDLTSEDQQLIAFNYTNTQPMWCSDNFKKGKKYYGD